MNEKCEYPSAAAIQVASMVCRRNWQAGFLECWKKASWISIHVPSYYVDGVDLKLANSFQKDEREERNCDEHTKSVEMKLAVVLA